MRNVDDEQVYSSNERFSSMDFSKPTAGYYDAKKKHALNSEFKKEG